MPGCPTSAEQTLAALLSASNLTTDRARTYQQWCVGERYCSRQEEKMIRIPKEWRPKPCSCGLGKLWKPQYDARGIFLTYTCEDCHDRKMAEFRPDLLTDPLYWTDEPIDED
jgi:hypothetical protein